MRGRDVSGHVAATLALLALSACSQSDVISELRSLSGSEDTVFLCRDDLGVGHPLSDCPDRNWDDDATPGKKLSVMALVTQTVTDEVAVVDVTAGRVVDVDRSSPGYGFLRVGGRPVSLATTPGGMATFVATADVGRNGLFALPTKCLAAPAEGRLELTSWPACRLDEAPGEVAVLIERSPGPATGQCKLYDENDEPAERDESACSADVIHEGGPEGRRKLLVSFPDSGRVRVYDAQELLDRPAGTFADCRAELELELKVEVPKGVSQVLPPDLAPESEQNACSESPAPVAPRPSPRGAQPAGFAVADNRLYIADQAAPVIHVLDTSSVCSLTELPSLLPMSLREPERVVVTRRVAVSPLTPAGERFVYAIDAEDQPGASVMVFDVSPGSTNPTPLVRPGSPELAAERPDRLWLSSGLVASSAKDVAFAYRDIPYTNLSTGAAVFGTRCDPSPMATLNEPSTMARPNADYTSGARPGLLRGLFGFVLLTNGQIAVVDEDDLDGDCRRPISSNPTSTPDFRGCVNDPIPGFFTEGGTEEGARLVTDEVSCRVVDPHSVRSSRLAVNDGVSGVRAPSLRNFPLLTLPPSAVSTESENRARLLAVPYVGAGGEVIPAETYIGSIRYSSAGAGTELLPTDPNGSASDQLQALNSVVLPPLEPRSYANDDTVTVTYEGSFAGNRLAGFLTEDGGFSDDSLSFCSAGVYDVATMADYAAGELGLSAEQAESFGVSHADYVQLTTRLLDERDSYWATSGVSRSRCVELFGPEDAEPLLRARDLSIVSASASRLQLEPRDPNVDLRDITECFPAAQRYRLRAGGHWVLIHSSRGFRHDIVESGADRRCVRSCNPLKKWEKGRVFEISSINENCRALEPDVPEPDEPGEPGEPDAPGEVFDPLTQRVGCAEAEVACVYDQALGAVPLDSPAAKCIFDGLNERFALYRGRAPSERDQAFTWQTTGGFAPLVMSLASISTAVSPQSIQFLPQSEQLAVVDGSSQGLSLFSLDTFTVVKPSPFY